MAHADYACCAVCDGKLYYSYDAPTKEKICSTCAVMLTEANVPAMNVQEFSFWLKNEDLEIVLAVLVKVGFKFCQYDNSVDEVLTARLESAGIIKEHPYGKRLVEVLSVE